MHNREAEARSLRERASKWLKYRIELFRRNTHAFVRYVEHDRIERSICARIDAGAQRQRDVILNNLGGKKTRSR
jgi:hypothetical protein